MNQALPGHWGEQQEVGEEPLAQDVGIYLNLVQPLPTAITPTPGLCTTGSDQLNHGMHIAVVRMK